MSIIKSTKKGSGLESRGRGCQIKSHHVRMLTMPRALNLGDFLWGLVLGFVLGAAFHANGVIS